MSSLSVVNDPIYERALLHAVCRDSLYEFVKRAWTQVEPAPYVDNWHVEAVCAHLQAVTEGKLKKLLVNIPPGCSKSLLTSVFWPAWEWIRHPDTRWFYASYDQRLSTRDSVRCRALITSSWYQSLFGSVYQITDDQNLKVYYETTAGGFRMATSVGGHGTGEHPRRIVLDDPHDVTGAESEQERQAVIQWWDLTMSTRGVSLDASRVIIMQRLHTQDLSGHVLSKGDWTHLCLCMRHEPGRMTTTSLGWNDPRQKEGDLLAPLQFDEARVKEMEINLGPYGASSQLQQRPTPRKGGLFEEEFFSQRVRVAPYAANRVRYWDRASSTATGACNTAGVLMARSSDGRYYVEDVVVGQWAPRQRNLKIQATAKRDRLKYGPKYEPVIWIEREGGASGRDAWQEIARQLAGFRVREHNVAQAGNKVFRAEPWSDQLAAGNVYVVDGGESQGVGKSTWDVNAYVQEHCAFPLADLKDRVDASSGAFSCLAKTPQANPLKVVTLRRSTSEKGIRLVVCTRAELQNLLIEERSLLISFVDRHDHTDVVHSLEKMLASLRVDFADVDPAEVQDDWNEPLSDGSLYEQIVMRRDDGKRIWSFLTRRYEHNADVIVFAGADKDDRRAPSVAVAVFRYLRVLKASITVLGRDESSQTFNEDDLNAHVVSMTQSCRSMVAT